MPRKQQEEQSQPVNAGLIPFPDLGSFFTGMKLFGGAPPSTPQVLSGLGSVPAAGGTGLLGNSGLLGASSALAPIAAAPIAAATAAGTVSGIGKLLNKQKMNLKEEAALALPTFGASFLIDPVNEFFGSGKNPRQKQRDAARNSFEDILGEGRTFPGIGGSTLQIEHHELDESNPLHAQAIAFADPIAETLAQGDKEKREDISALMANAASTGARSIGDVKNQFLSLVNRLGVNADDVERGLLKFRDKGLIDQNRFKVNMHNLNQLRR